jgi:hypothetical protein
MMLPQRFNTTDKLIRSALINKLYRQYQSQLNTAIISEFSLMRESVRIDIAVVNGKMHGYELKSDRDNLLRLENQKDAYNLVFDKVTLVVGKNHLVDSIYAIPEWWGITVAKINRFNEISLLNIRASKPNPDQDIYAMANLLWKNEIVEKLIELGFPRSISRKPKDFVSEQLVNSLQYNRVKSYIRQTLRYRFFNSDWRVGATLM